MRKLIFSQIGIVMAKAVFDSNSARRCCDRNEDLELLAVVYHRILASRHTPLIVIVRSSQPTLARTSIVRVYKRRQMKIREIVASIHEIHMTAAP